MIIVAILLMSLEYLRLFLILRILKVHNMVGFFLMEDQLTNGWSVMLFPMVEQDHSISQMIREFRMHILLAQPRLFMLIRTLNYCLAFLILVSLLIGVLYQKVVVIISESGWCLVHLRRL